MSFALLFSIQLSHDYYSDSICRDITIIPTAACQKKLKGYRLLSRNKLGGLDIYVPLNTHAVPLIPLTPNMVFSFELAIQNPHFFYYTDQLQLSQKHLPFFKSTSGVDETIGVDHPTKRLTDIFYANENEQGTQVFHLRATPVNHQPQDFVVDALADASVNYDNSNNTFTLTHNTALTESTLFSVSYNSHYISTDIPAEDLMYQGTDTFIAQKAMNPPNGPEVFQFQQEAKQGLTNSEIIIEGITANAQQVNNSKRFTLTPQPTLSGDNSFTATYPAYVSLRSGQNPRLDIQLEAIPAGTSLPPIKNYKISFAVKSRIWTYYILGEKEEVADPRYSVGYLASSNGGHPQDIPFIRTVLTEAQIAEEAITASLQSQALSEDFDIYKFQSAEAANPSTPETIPYAEKPIQRIALLERVADASNPLADKTIMANLPNPPIDNEGIVSLNLTKPP